MAVSVVVGGTISYFAVPRYSEKTVPKIEAPVDSTKADSISKKPTGKPQ